MEGWVSSGRIAGSQGRRVKTQVAGPHLQNFWFNRSGYELRICFPYGVPGDAAVPRPGTTLGEPVM